jgi:hypothetical protein
MTDAKFKHGIHNAVQVCLNIKEVDCVPTDCTIEVDGKILMKEGKFQL